MSDLARALLDELGPDDLERLAERLRPFLAADDGWLGARDAAAYAGCTVPALRYAVSRRRGRVRAARAGREGVLPGVAFRPLATEPHIDLVVCA